MKCMAHINKWHLPRTCILVLIASTLLTIVAVEIWKRNTKVSVPDLAYNHSSTKDRHFEELDTQYMIPKDVYYFWCGPERNFEFRHYLSVLSVFAYLKPYRVTFFYENKPTYQELSHDTWLLELTQSYPFFNTNKLSPEWCEDIDYYVEKYLRAHGGIFVHEEVVLLAGSFPDERVRSFDRIAVVDDDTNINLLLISSRHQSEDASKINCLGRRRPISFLKTNWKLGDAEKVLNQSGTIEIKACNRLVSQQIFFKNTGLLFWLDAPLFPEQIWELDSETGRQLRTVAYGKPELAQPVPDFSRLAPNIAHVIWTNKDPMRFHFYLCVLSLLEVANFEKVYIHGDGPPTGMYWDMIRKHPRLRLVTRTVIEGKYERIYGTKITGRAHVVDVLRLDILNRYGGLYVDTDAIIVRPLTKILRAYDAVVSPDVESDRDGFPNVFQNGIMLGKPGAAFWRLMLESNKRYHNDDWLWNCCVTLYRVKERYPTTVLEEPRLNTICNRFKCHPTWDRKFANSTEEDIAKVMKHWRNSTFALHHTYPDLPEFTDHRALLANNGTTLFGEVGLYVLEQSGKLDFFRHLIAR